MYQKFLAGCLISAVLSLTNTHAIADSKSANQYAIPHLEQEAVLDGKLEESVWQQSLAVPLEFEVEPGENIAAVEKTTAYLFENGEFLFVAFDARDSSPEQIRAYLSERDDIWQSDYLGFTLDTFNDYRKGYQFLANPIGIQSDSIIDEITNKQDYGWDAIWNSKGSVNDNGYVVEFSIPLKTLRFPDVKGDKHWGIQFFRFLPRSVKHKFSNSIQDRNNNCKLCQFESYSGLSSLNNSSSVMLIPSVTMQQAEQRTLVTTDWESETSDRESLDIRWSLNQNNFVSATINPDFSEVETDALQIETNKRFAVFVPEKRAFFTEGADFFSNSTRLIHTKIFLEPEYGIKLVGKEGDHSYGLMSIEDKDTRFLLPGSQSSRLVTLENNKSTNQLFRYRYDIGKQANLGVTYTDRTADDYSNRMLSLNGKYWLTESDYVRFELMSSDTENPLEIQQSYARKANESGNALTFSYTHSSRNWSWILANFHFEDDFRADSGFFSRSNWKRTGAQIARKWYPTSNGSWWDKISLSGVWNEDSEIDGIDLSSEKGFELAIEGKYQSEFGFAYTEKEEEFSTIYYDTNSLDLFAFWTPYAGIDLGLSLSRGDQIDFSSARLGEQTTLESNISYQINQHWKIKLDYIDQSLNISGDGGFDLEIYNLNTLYQYDRQNYFRITIQGQSEDSNRSIATQLLYKYKVNPFTLFYVGYSDQGFKTTEFNRFKKVDRRVFVKFSYAWQL